MTARPATEALLIATAAAWAAWDVYAYLRHGQQATITQVVRDTSRAWPVLPLLVGVVLGHLFWGGE